MSTTRTTESPGSPVPGAIPEPVRVQHDDAPPVAPARSDPGAERETRRTLREQRRGPRAKRPAGVIPKRRQRPPLEAPLKRVVATAGIVGIAIVIAAIISSQGSQGWQIGLVVSLASLILAAVLWSSRRL